jgi:hypothetical protein
MLILLVYLFFLLLLIPFYLFAPTEMDKTVMVSLLVLFVFLLSLFIYPKRTNQKTKGFLLKHSTLFILGFCIVHFQYYFDFVLGNISKENLFIWVNRDIVIKSFILSLIGLVSFFLGFLIIKPKIKPQLQDEPQSIYNTKLLLIFSIISLATFFLTVNPLYLVGYYGSEDMGVEATYAILFFSISIYAIIIQNCRNMIISKVIPSNFRQYVKQQGYLFFFIICVYLLSVMISGDRGPIITFGTAYFSGYFIVTQRRPKRMYWASLIFIGAFSITLLGEIRNFNKDLDFYSKVLESINSNNKTNENSILPVTSELAASVRTLHTSLDYVPQKHDFLSGQFQFQQLVTSVPLVYYVYELFIEKQKKQYGSSATFITWINQGDDPKSGDGTSCIADLYLDWGLFGVIFGMFLFGYLIKLLEFKLFNIDHIPGLFCHVFGIIYLSNAIYIARSSILFEFRSVIWVLILLYLNIFVNKLFFKTVKL